MPILSLDPLSVFDIALLAIICLGLPVQAELSREKVRARILSGEAGARERLYRSTIVMLWTLALLVLGLWLVAGRGWAELGFVAGHGWTLGVGWGLAALVSGFFTWQWFGVMRSDAVRRKFCTELEAMGENLYFLPQSEAEFRLFRTTAVTAGITEEIIFRGFVIWGFAHVMPVWAAAALSLAVFTWLHRYQGLAQLLPVFLIGLVMTVIVVLSGSLWPAIGLHVVVDLLNGETVRAARAQPAVQPG